MTAGSLPPERRRTAEGLVVVASCLTLATLIGRGLPGPQRLADVVMVYLLGVVVVSVRYGRALSLGAAVASVLCFDFFFVPPVYTFAVDDPGHLVTFAVMLVVAIVISTLTRRVQQHAREAEEAALERERLARDNREAHLRAETEQIRSALLSSVSHDLRTPLAVVTGAASTLLDDKIAPAVRAELTETIMREAASLERRLENLLDMTRLEGGTIRLRRQWQPLEEVVGVALRRTEAALSRRDVMISLPEKLSLVPIDGGLIEQVFVNLLENAAKHTPEGTPIHIAAHDVDGAVEIHVDDRGPGVPAGDTTRIFEKFQRGDAEVAGAGLGLSICRAIIAAHGGQIWVTPREGSGASFRFTIPIVGDPPTMEEGATAS
jgi:two-component system, OmpR family, sensor histidine kinase KdpD